MVREPGSLSVSKNCNFVQRRNCLLTEDKTWWESFYSKNNFLTKGKNDMLYLLSLTLHPKHFDKKYIFHDLGVCQLISCHDVKFLWFYTDVFKHVAVS